VTAAQARLLDLPERDVDVVLAREVPARAHERVVVEDVEDARDRQQHVVLADLDVVEAREIRVLAVAAALAVAVTTAVATPAAAAAALVVQLLAVVATVALALAAALLAALLALAVAALLVALALAARRVAVTLGAGRARAPARAARPAVARHEADGRRGTRRTLVGRLVRGVARADALAERLGHRGGGLGARVATALAALGPRLVGAPGQVEHGSGGALLAARGRRRVVARRGLGARGARRGTLGAAAAAAPGGGGRLAGLTGRGARPVRVAPRRGGALGGALLAGAGADDVHEIALAHLGRALDPELRGEGLQLREAQRGERAGPGVPAGSGRTGRAARGGVDGVCHEGPFPLVCARLSEGGPRVVDARSSDRCAGVTTRQWYDDVS